MARTTILLLALAVSLALLAGCGRETDRNRDGKDGHGDHGDHGSASMHDASEEDHGDGDHEMGGHGDGEHDHGDHGEGAAPADLPEGANATCPVMGGPVDPAIFTEYKGKKVYFCCDECVEKFKKDPERYFGKAYPDAETR